MSFCHTHREIPAVVREPTRCSSGHRTPLDLTVVGRGDLVIVGTFLPLWVTQIGLEQGMSTGQAMARAGIMLSVMQLTIVFWAYIAGYLNDRMNRVNTLALAFTLASVGYFGIWLIGDPFSIITILFIIILGTGEVSITVSSSALIGEQAPKLSRGAILGVFGVSGAVGIMIATYIGGEIFDAVGKTAPFLMMVFFNLVIITWALYIQFFDRKQSAVTVLTKD